MRSNRLFAIAIVAAAAISSAVVSAYEHAVAAVRSAWGYVVSAWSPTPSTTTIKANADLNPALLLVAAKAFMQRMAKRERPRVTTLWRMCPSI